MTFFSLLLLMRRIRLLPKEPPTCFFTVLFTVIFIACFGDFFLLTTSTILGAPCTSNSINLFGHRPNELSSNGKSSTANSSRKCTKTTTSLSVVSREVWGGCLITVVSFHYPKNFLKVNVITTLPVPAKGTKFPVSVRNST